jgi:hypothetical protein
MEAHMKIHPIYKRYKSIFVLTILFVILFISGCAGGGTEAGNPAQSAGPYESDSADSMLSISNLDYAPTSTEVGGGEINVTGSVDFMDEDGNVSFLIIDIIDSDNRQVEQITETIEGLSGQTSGTVDFTLTIDTEFQEDYTFEVYIMDETDNESNVLTGTFSVTD